MLQDPVAEDEIEGLVCVWDGGDGGLRDNKPGIIEILDGALHGRAQVEAVNFGEGPRACVL